MPSWGSHPQAPSHGVNDPKVTGVLQRSPEDPHGEAEGAAGCTARGQRGHVPGAAGNRPRDQQMLSPTLSPCRLVGETFIHFSETCRGLRVQMR